MLKSSVANFECILVREFGLQKLFSNFHLSAKWQFSLSAHFARNKIGKVGNTAFNNSGKTNFNQQETQLRVRAKNKGICQSVNRLSPKNTCLEMPLPASNALPGLK